MRAIFIERYGAPDRLVERSIRDPIPSDGEVKIEVRAAGVNFADLLQRLHLYGNAPRLPYIPGFEVAGVVCGRGKGVSCFKAGDRVMAIVRSGGYSERICVPAAKVRLIPEGLSFSEAASLPVNYLTAWFCLFQMGGLSQGKRVLIHSAAGGVGLAAVQLSLHCGAQVFATAGSQEKVDFVKKQGVAGAVNYRETDFAEVFRRDLGGPGLDLVIDSLGGDVLRKSCALLAPLGRAVSYGLASAVSGERQNWLRTLWAVWKTPTFRPLDLIGKNIGIFGFHLALLGEHEPLAEQVFDQIVQLVESGKVIPVVAAEFGLSAAGTAAAHRYLHQRKNIGKVVLVN